MVHNLPDGLSVPQPVAIPSEKTTSETTNKITQHAEQDTAELAAKQLTDGHETSVHIPIHREEIEANRTPPSDVSGMVENFKEQGSIPVFFHVPVKEARKNYAADKLFAEKNMSPGREKFLTAIVENPGRLEQDLNRQSVTIGDTTREKSYFVGDRKTPDVIYRYLSAHVSGYIKEENPELSVDRNKMDEILNSIVQTFRNDISITRNDVIPREPWEARQGKGTEEAKFEFESKPLWDFSKPEVLVVTTRSTKEYTNINDSNAKPIVVIIEAQVKHNLKTNDVAIVYKLSIDGKVEEWDPTVRFTAPPAVLKSEKLGPAEKFRTTIKESHYQELKREIPVINRCVNEQMVVLKAFAQKSELGSAHLTLNESNKSSHILRQMTANGKYGLTIQGNGDVFLHVPSTVFAQGGEKKVSFTIQLFANNQQLTQTSAPSIFKPTVFAEIENAQVAVFAEPLNPEDSSIVEGEKKVMNSSISNFDHILKPRLITQFTAQGNEATPKTGVIMPYCDGGDLRNKVFDLKNEESFNTYKTHAEGVLRGLNAFHEARVYHGDLKPENIMLRNGVAVIADFGKVVTQEEIAMRPVKLDNKDYEFIKKKLIENSELSNGDNVKAREAYQNLMDKFDNLKTEKKDKILTPDIRNELVAYREAIQSNDNQATKNQINQIDRLLKLIDNPITSVIRSQGTPAYDPPEANSGTFATPFELAQPQAAKASADSFRLGATLFQLSHEIDPQKLDEAYRNQLLDELEKRGVQIEGTESNNELEKILNINITKHMHINFKQLKEDMKPLLNRAAVDEFKNKYSNELPPSENERIILQLLNDDPAVRPTVKETLDRFQGLKYLPPAVNIPK